MKTSTKIAEYKDDITGQLIHSFISDDGELLGCFDYPSELEEEGSATLVKIILLAGDPLYKLVPDGVIMSQDISEELRKKIS